MRDALLFRCLITLLALRDFLPRIFRRDWAGCSARLGHTRPDHKRPTLWLHAASNGEITSAKPVLERLLACGKPLLVTVNTESAAALARGWNLPDTTVLLAPYDLSTPTRRVMDRWNVAAHITFESDLWPNRVLSCPGPVLVLGGRLTARSAKGWERLPSLSRRVVGKLRYLSAQDSGSRDRFAAFGLAPAAVGPVVDLKALYAPPDLSPDALLENAFPRHATWLAASTHEGEEEIILEAHKRALAEWPDLRLILAPRHPKRADAIAALLSQHDLTFARRSRKDAPGKAQVLLADTLGEMPLWYQLAGLTFVAGSLTNRGGHTPYEPAHFCSAILHGPDTSNFKAAYQRLREANAAQCVDSAAQLATALLALKSPETQTSKGTAARAALQATGTIDDVMRDVMSVLDA